MLGMFKSNYDGVVTATVNFIARMWAPLGKPLSSVYLDPICHE
jgi:hypothetical protein